MPAVDLSGITKRFGRRVALDDVSLTLNGAEIVGLVGPNGAGKTTMLRILAGLVHPTRGSVQIEPRCVVRHFGGERTLPPDVSARRWMWLVAPSAAPDTTTRTLGVLSRGTRQRIGLEAALAGRDAGVIVLDEPWEGLDPDASRWLSDALLARRRDGCVVLVSSHRIHDLASVCDRCELLVGGRLATSAIACSELPHHGRTAALYDAFDRARTGP